MSHDRRRLTSDMTRIFRSLPRALVVAALCLLAHPALAQQNSSTWTWSGDANIFVGFNYQQRLFADFSAWESQNWMMGSGERPLGDGRLIVQAMLSFEPFTIGKLVYGGGARVEAGGSPQLFQTGESYQGTPLVNYQHPHDLIMGFGATYQLERARLTYFFGADLVGSPT